MSITSFFLLRFVRSCFKADNGDKVTIQDAPCFDSKFSNDRCDEPHDRCLSKDQSHKARSSILSREDRKRSSSSIDQVAGTSNLGLAVGLQYTEAAAEACFEAAAEVPPSTGSAYSQMAEDCNTYQSSWESSQLVSALLGSDKSSAGYDDTMNKGITSSQETSQKFGIYANLIAKRRQQQARGSSVQASDITLFPTSTHLLVNKLPSSGMGQFVAEDRSKPLLQEAPQRSSATQRHSLNRASSAAFPSSSAHALSGPNKNSPASQRFQTKAMNRRRRSRSCEAFPWEMSSGDSEEERVRAQDTLTFLKRQLTLHEQSRRSCGSLLTVPSGSDHVGHQEGRAILGNYDLEVFCSNVKKL